MPVVEKTNDKALSYLYIELQLNGDISVLQHATGQNDNEVGGAASLLERLAKFKKIIKANDETYSLRDALRIINQFLIFQVIKGNLGQNDPLNDPLIKKNFDEFDFFGKLNRVDFSTKSSEYFLIQSDQLKQINSDEQGQWGRITDDSDACYLILRLNVPKGNGQFLIFEMYKDGSVMRYNIGFRSLETLLNDFDGKNLFKISCPDKLKVEAAKKILLGQHPSVKLALSDSQNKKNLFQRRLDEARQEFANFCMKARALGLREPVWNLDPQEIAKAEQAYEKTSAPRLQEESKSNNNPK